MTLERLYDPYHMEGCNLVAHGPYEQQLSQVLTTPYENDDGFFWLYSMTMTMTMLSYYHLLDKEMVLEVCQLPPSPASFNPPYPSSISISSSSIILAISGGGGREIRYFQGIFAAILRQA